MRKIFVAVAAVLLTLLPVPVQAGPADDGDTRRCISRSEWRYANSMEGWSQRRTAEQFEVAGLGVNLTWWPEGVVFPRCDAVPDMYDLGNGYYGFSFRPGEGLADRIECKRDPAIGPCYTGYNR